MKKIEDINRDFKKDKIILFGSGPSLDKLNLKELEDQKEYDTFVIADAIKLLKKPTFAINYHYDGLLRIYSYIEKPEYMLMPHNIISFKIAKEKRYNHPIQEDKMLSLETRVFSEKNCYFFTPQHLKHDIIKLHRFSGEYKGKIYHGTGSIVGALYFLISYMEYRDIYYIGFDGGINPDNFNYSQVTDHPRKPNKEEGARLDYIKSWEESKYLLEKFPKVKFNPLSDFLK